MPSLSTSEPTAADKQPSVSPSLLCLRPGAEVFDISAERLQISFANYTATFSSTSVVKGVWALLKVLERPHARNELVRQAAELAELEPEFVDYLVQQLIQTDCLYVTTTPPDAATTSDALTEFYASLGKDPRSTLNALAEFRSLLVTPADCAEEAAQVLEASKLKADLVALPAGITCAAGLMQVKAGLTIKPRIIVSWNFPYRLPFARFLNDLAIEQKISILFGVCEGLMGRIGPYVIPRNTACLECLNRRLLTHAGDLEMQVFAESRIRFQDLIPPARPAHPVFRAAIARLFALELSQIVLNFPPNTLGGVIEYNYADGVAQRHPIYKVPRCEACYEARPQRTAWDAKFTAPVVKDGAE